ncbi:MAG: MFS transporter [Acidimicrobiales bacterium]
MDRKWWTLVAVCAGVFMLLLDVTIVNVALPDIERSFAAPLSDLQWVISAYALSLAIFLLTAGSLADRFGRRASFAIGIVVFSAGSLACGLAPSTAALIASRAGQGVGGAIMFATSLALLADAFRGADRGVAFGAFGAVTGVAVAVGPVLGGIITSGISWRWIFFVNLPVGAAALGVTLARVAESRDPAARRVDWAGFATFSAGLAALVYALIAATTDGWGSASVIGSLVAAAVLLTSFVVIERLQATPMFDLSLLRVPTFDGGLVAAWAISASLFSLLTYLIIYVQNILGLTAVAAGIRFLPLTGSIFLTAGAAGRLTTHVPKRLLIAPGFLLVGTGLALMRGLTPSSTWTHLLAGMIVSGIGAGLVNVPLAATAVGVVEPARAGMASGINSTLRQVGIATGVAALGTIFASRVRYVATVGLSGSPLAQHAAAIAHAISAGGAGQVIASLPPSDRAFAAAAAKAAFVQGLDTILLVGAVVAFVAAVASFFLVREADFVAAEEPEALVHAA